MISSFLLSGDRELIVRKWFILWSRASSLEQDLVPRGKGSENQRLPRQRELSGDRSCFFFFFWWPAASEERAKSLRNSLLSRGLLTRATARTPARLRDEVGRACTEARRDCAKAILGRRTGRRGGGGEGGVEVFLSFEREFMEEGRGKTEEKKNRRRLREAHSCIESGEHRSKRAGSFLKRPPVLPFLLSVPLAPLLHS